MGNLLEALGVNFKMVLIQAVGFLFLLLLLRKFLFGRIKDMIKARSDEIKDTYKKSDDVRSEAERLKGEYQRKVIQAEEEAEGKIQAAVVKAKEISDEIVKEAHQTAANDRAKAQQGIEVEKKKALAEVRNQVIDLTILSSTRLIQQTMQRKTAEKLVDNVIKEVGKMS
ncbi:MAG: F0F1 ATP synthase subunit B [Candidatus Scalindua sp.]